MAEKNRLKCETDFDDFLKKVNRWIEAQEKIREAEEITPENVEEITKLFEEVEEAGKVWGKCEFSSSQK